MSDFIDINTDSHEADNRPHSWQEVDWKAINREVIRFRKRIFLAAKQGNYKNLRNLQRLCIKSKSNLLYSIRHVTYGSGRKTPGMDGIVILTPKERWETFLKIQSTDWNNYNPIPARRVYILRPDGRKRPLGIPTIHDRILQMVIKNALEPEWESRFESGSYGFRPSRSVNDAINRIFVALNKPGSRVWVVDADVSQCFDNISHTHLIQKLKYFPMLKTIQAWLESGITIGNAWFQTIEGTPQGAVLSPLLCNIAMHGLEKELGVRIINDKGHLDTKGRLLVRYADDFTVFCRNKSDSEAASEQLSKSLKERGLELNLLKTKISHAAEGFDFLGFNIRYRPKYGADPTRAIIPLPEGDYYVDYNLASIYIHPSEKSIKKVMDSIKNIFLNHQGKPAKELINKTNPIIRGWAESKRHWHCTSTFRKLDHYLYNLQWRWMRRQHPNKSVGWLKKRYFTTLILGPINNNWVFADPLNRKVVMHQFKWYPQYNHVMIRNLAVPDDPNLTEYFEELEITRAELKPPSLFSTFENNLFISQDGICPICENSLSNGESLHKHHIIPKSQEGKDTFTNILILHLACHYQIHSRYENFYQSLVDFKADHPCVYSNEQRKKMREARRKARLRKKGNNTL